MGSESFQTIRAGDSSWPITPDVIWNYRHLLWRLTLREFQIRYRQTVLGLTWVILQPLLALAVFSLFLGRLAQIPTNGIPYQTFALSGLIIWTYVSNCFIHGSTAVVENREVIQQLYFPRAFIPLSIILSKLVDLFIGFLLLLLWMGFVEPVPLHAGLLLFPLLLVALLTFLIGIVLFFSAVCVRFRDVRHVVPFLTQVWFFATPIVYPTSMTSEEHRWIFQLNPVATFVEMFRNILFGGPSLSPYQILATVLVSILTFVFGSIYFRRIERLFADLI